MQSEQHWSEELVQLGACAEAVTWAKTQPSRSKAWASCERPDWMLWYLHKAGADHKLIVLCAYACAAANDAGRAAAAAAYASARLKANRRMANLIRKWVPKASRKENDHGKS